MDEACAEAVPGIIRCQLAAENIDDAAQQLDFHSQIKTGVASPLMVLLNAELEAKRRGPKERIVELLGEACKAQLAASRKPTLDIDPVVAFDPDFLLEAARLLVSQVSLDPSDVTEGTKGVLGKACEVLAAVKARFPGFIPAVLLLGQCTIALGDKEEGLKHINACIALDGTNSEIHITLAQIYTAQGATAQAQSALEQALAFDFAVRELPLYNLIRAQGLVDAGNLPEAQRILEQAMTSPGVRQPARPEQLAKNRYADVPQHVRASIFVALAGLYARRGQRLEAAKVIQDARSEFTGTAEEMRVTIAACEVALESGDVDKAMETLRGIAKTDPYYVKSRTTLAKIYLKNKSDRRSYIRTYQELIRDVPGSATYTLAAEAFMLISEPEDAIKCYEAAIRLNPRDAQLSSKIGKVLVTTHDYRKAISFYEEGVKADPQNMVLRRDLADLYVKLKKHDDAQRLLIESLKVKKADADVTNLVQEVGMLVLLAEVQRRSGKVQVAVELIDKAAAKQNALITRCRVEKPEIVDEQKKVAASLAIKAAELTGSLRGKDGAQEDATRSYNEALRFTDNNIEALRALARLTLNQGNLDACQEHCLTILRTDQGDEEATIMLADVMFRRSEVTTALYHFEQLLEKKPAHFGALSRVLVLLRMVGRLDDSGKRLLSQAEASSPRVALEPGFHYCKGLLARFAAEPVQALKEFNIARKDPEWGVQSLRNMIEIYLIVDDQDLWDDGAESALNLNHDRITAAQKLLEDVPDKTTPLYQWLRGQILLAQKDSRSTDLASEIFTNLLTADRDSVFGLLGLAIASQLKKDSTKARNHLKRIAKMDYQHPYAAEFEKAYLMLAELYIEGGKLDQALALIKTCLSHNASCGKAWEFQGKIQEKDLAYKDAGDSYEMAWSLEKERSTAIGYKLAFNYLKAGRLVDAINVCHKVLKIDPKYPKIRKDILDRARSQIRI